jgi:hypothetical protein
VAKGFTQVENIDFHETFSPIARMESIRVMLSIVTNENLEVHQMNLKTTFLNVNISKEIYMQQLEGFMVKDKDNMVYKFQKSFYGLKQSPNEWNHNINAYFLFWEFEKNFTNNNFYFKII